MTNDTISITWCVDDVLSIAPTLSRDDCRNVLERVERGHDATIGVNWDVIEEHVRRYKRDKNL